MSTPVYTYFNPVPLLSLEDETKLILRWRRSWMAHGFTPIVLNQWSIMKHPLYQELTEKIKQLPSVNPPSYDAACYLRWLAMANIGGGIMTDYDVMNYGWTPQLTIGKHHKSKSELAKMLSSGTLHCMQNHVPSVVVGDGSAFLNMAMHILNYKVTVTDYPPENPTKPHVSDMLMLEKLARLSPGSYEQRLIVRNFGEPSWETAGLVHFSTGSTSPNYLPRWKHIPLLRSK